MADALLKVVLDQLASIVRQELEQEVRLVVGVRKEIKKLSFTFRAIQAVIDDAERRQVKDELVKVWLEELKDVAYDMDDVLDEWRTEILRSQFERVGNSIMSKKKVCSYFFSSCSCFNQVALRHDIGHRIKEIRERLDVIASDKDKYKFVEGRRVGDSERQMSSSLINISEIYGRDLDKDILTSKLLSESSRQEKGLPVVSIIGMGGLGKTTLAQLVFNDDKVKSHFEKTVWVCVSDPFDKVRIAKAIIEEAGEPVPDVIEWQALHRQLSNSVQGKLFLLVLDDVWTEDHKNWDVLKASLQSSKQGSRILVTTRNERVAVMMGTTYTHRLGVLSPADCWTLFCSIAFIGRGKEECEKLEEIGKKIAHKCTGVPLAVKTIGGLMCFKTTKQDWRVILESEAWELPEVEEGVLPALLLSYYDLSSPLKRCFAYCAIFPKDHPIEKELLIKLWMAQGFVSSTGRREMEVIGGEYFNKLVMRSFLQDLEKDKDGNITFCKMHDLLHDFALFLTKNECPIMEVNSNTTLNYSKVRHCYNVDINLIPLSTSNVKNLRTLKFSMGSSGIVNHNLFHHLTCLRVLDLQSTGLEKIPSEIEKLIHLRYLDLSWTKLKELPETVSNLYNLQTLRLEMCTELCKLPEGMRKVINLRHLEIMGNDELNYLPRGIGRLSSLQTLSKFIVDGISGCEIGELKELNLLQGYLEITGLGRVKNVNEAKEANLKKKQHLRTLILDFRPNELTHLGADFRPNEWANVGADEVERMGGVIEGLQPHSNLEILDIRHYLGSKLPSWMMNESILSNLLSLGLDGCKNCTQLPVLWKLSSLEELNISSMDAVKHIGPEFYGIGSGGGGGGTAFPKLKKLYIACMSNLEKFDLGAEDGEEIMPRLLHLHLAYCPKLNACLNFFPNTLRELEITDCPEFTTSRGLPTHLKELVLRGDTGVLSKSLPLLPNLKSLTIIVSPHSSFPEGLGQLKSLQSLTLWHCKSMMCMSEELQHLTTLRELIINECPILGPRCQKDVGEDWKIISHISCIQIDLENI